MNGAALRARLPTLSAFVASSWAAFRRWRGLAPLLAARFTCTNALASQGSSLYRPGERRDRDDDDDDDDNGDRSIVYYSRFSPT